jgi:hypothetical protein
MANAWGVSWGESWGVSWGENPAASVAATIVRRHAPHTTERLYLPPGKYTKKRTKEAISAVKRLYREARREIPKQLQVGLVPEVFVRGHIPAHLPLPGAIDFESLAQSLDTIRVLIAALEAQRKKRRQEEEAFVMLLMDLL